MIFLATGDIHCANYRQFNYTRPDGMGSRLYNTLRVFDILLEQAQKLGINKILLNGDIFNDSSFIETEVFDAVYRRIEKLHKMGMQVCINVGNHDVCHTSSSRMLHSLRAFRKVAQVIERPTLVWKKLWIVPWSDPATIKDNVKQGIGLADILVLHCAIHGATTGPSKHQISSVIQLDDIHPKEFRLVLLSDFHTHQWLRSNTFYLGSPLQHSFGETNQPRLWHVQLGKHWKADPIPTDLPRFRRFTVTTKDDAAKRIRKHPSDYFRMDVTPDSKVDPAVLERLVRKYNVQVQITHTEEKSGSLEEVPETVEMLGALKSYVKSQVSRKGERRRLFRLGEKLYSRVL